MVNAGFILGQTNDTESCNQVCNYIYADSKKETDPGGGGGSRVQKVGYAKPAKKWPQI